jgi:two-component system, cell cycle response regulator DivK
MSQEPILIVDDNPMNLKLEKRLLEIEGYQVLTAKSAKETLKVLGYFRPRLILMDFQLPVLDGMELTRKLRKDPANRDIVIVMLTSYDQQGDEQKARAAGCDGYIPKPIQTQSFPGIVAGYLKRTIRGTGQSGK